MPPKKKQDGPSKKNQEKAKEKVIEDKTFGLKNKKGRKQQQFIKTVTHQVKHGGNQAARKLDQMKEEDKQKKKDSKQNKLDELNLLFKPVQIQQKVSAGADPKSVLCAFFKQGLCTKGNKCKFSHDLSLERKGEKRSLYADERQPEKDGGMDDWSQDQLEEVIKKKHEEAEKKKPKTNIICKYFLEAIDKSLYGWFWTCPKGEKCIYKHALPPGFVLKRKEVAKSIEDQVSLEELIERERSNLGDTLTPVTLNTFLVWKKKKLKEKKENLEKEVNKKKEDFERGKSVGKVSGRELFLFKPELAEDDDDEAADDPNLYRREEEQDHAPVKEITIETLAAIAQQSDGTGTKAKCLSGKKAQESQNESTMDCSDEKTIEHPLADLNGTEEACAANFSLENKDQILLDGVPVEESLFEDDVDDLELDELDIND